MCAAIWRARRFGPQLSLGVWRDSTLKIYVIRIVHSQQILYTHQYGFRQQHSTIHPIIHLLNKCAEMTNSQPKQYIMSVFCDLSKAFNVIDHKILFAKLEYYGFRGIVKKWLADYLSNRTQFVEFESYKSNRRNIECGVPQGSILGPLLYLIYVNDIPRAANADILSFADDTSLLLSNPDIEQLYVTANTELYKWFCANTLSLNASKTKYIIFRSNHQRFNNNEHSVQIDGVKLCQIGRNHNEKSTKFLGVFIDEFLTWESHINHIHSTISRAIFMIKQVKNLLPTDSLKTLYYTMIHPYLTYGILAWGNATQANLKKIIVLQKRAIRIIHKVPYNGHTEPLHKKSKILKLGDQYKFEATLFMHNYAMGKLPLSFANMCTFNYESQANVQTRQSNLIRLPRCNSSFASKLPKYNFPKLWNNWVLKDQMNLTLSPSQTKKKLKDTFLSAYAHSVVCTNSHCIECRN